MASPNAGHAAWVERLKAETRAKHGGLSQKEVKRKKALLHYYANHDENKEKQRLRHREYRRRYGDDRPWRAPKNLIEAVRAVSRFDEYSRRGTFRQRTFSELMEAHETWLESIDLWRMAERGELPDELADLLE